MKQVYRLYDKDIVALLIDLYDFKPSEITSCLTIEVDEETGLKKPIFYIDINMMKENEENETN